MILKHHFIQSFLSKHDISVWYNVIDASSVKSEEGGFLYCHPICASSPPPDCGLTLPLLRIVSQYHFLGSKRHQWHIYFSVTSGISNHVRFQHHLWRWRIFLGFQSHQWRIYLGLQRFQWRIYLGFQHYQWRIYLGFSVTSGASIWDFSVTSALAYLFGISASPVAWHGRRDSQHISWMNLHFINHFWGIFGTILQKVNVFMLIF